MNPFETLIYRFQYVSPVDFATLAIAIIIAVWYFSNYGD